MNDAQLLDRVRRRLATDTAEPTPQSVAAALRAEQRLTDGATVLTLVDALRRETLGVGPLEPLLAVDGVTDVLVNGPGAVYLDRGSGLERTEVRFADDEAVRRLAQRLASQAGRRLDESKPRKRIYNLGYGSRGINSRKRRYPGRDLLPYQQGQGAHWTRRRAPGGGLPCGG